MLQAIFTRGAEKQMQRIREKASEWKAQEKMYRLNIGEYIKIVEEEIRVQKQFFFPRDSQHREQLKLVLGAIKREFTAQLRQQLGICEVMEALGYLPSLFEFQKHFKDEGLGDIDMEILFGLQIDKFKGVIEDELEQTFKRVIQCDSWEKSNTQKSHDEEEQDLSARREIMQQLFTKFFQFESIFKQWTLPSFFPIFTHYCEQVSVQLKQYMLGVTSLIANTNVLLRCREIEPDIAEIGDNNWIQFVNEAHGFWNFEAQAEAIRPTLSNQLQFIAITVSNVNDLIKMMEDLAQNMKSVVIEQCDRIREKGFNGFELPNKEGQFNERSGYNKYAPDASVHQAQIASFAANFSRFFSELERKYDPRNPSCKGMSKQQLRIVKFQFITQILGENTEKNFGALQKTAQSLHEYITEYLAAKVVVADVCELILPKKEKIIRIGEKDKNKEKGSLGLFVPTVSEARFEDVALNAMNAELREVLVNFNENDNGSRVVFLGKAYLLSLRVFDHVIFGKPNSKRKISQRDVELLMKDLDQLKSLFMNLIKEKKLYKFSPDEQSTLISQIAHNQQPFLQAIPIMNIPTKELISKLEKQKKSILGSAKKQQRGYEEDEGGSELFKYVGDVRIRAILVLRAMFDKDDEAAKFTKI